MIFSDIYATIDLWAKICKECKIMELNTLLIQIEQIKEGNTEELLKASRKLLNAAKEQKDNDYAAKALYYMSLAYWKKGQIDKTMSSALKSLKYVTVEKDPEIFAKANNILGVLCYLDQNDTLALEYYLEGLESATQYKLESLFTNFMINIGSLYQNLNQHEKAIRYYKKAEKLSIPDEKDMENFYRSKVNVYINFSISYLHLGEYERADSYINQAFTYYERLKEKDLEFIVLCVWCRIRVKKEELEAAEKQLPRLLELFFQEEVAIDYTQDIGEFYDLLVDMKKKEELDRVLLLFEWYVKKQNIMSLLLQALDLRISYYKLIQDQENYQNKCIEYYELKKMHANETNEKRIKSIETRLALRRQEKNMKESEKINAHLQKKSEEDPLTHLGNRFRLENYFKRLMRETDEQEELLAVGIVDVDFFKEYNDYYGHVKGDECLRTASRVISSFVEQEQGICTRYGGDEFVMLLPNLNESQVRFIAENIMKEIRKLKIPHEKSTVSPVLTVSQGYYIGKVKRNVKLSDLIAKADKSLYWVKNKSRDNYHIDYEI